MKKIIKIIKINSCKKSFLYNNNKMQKKFKIKLIV